MAKVSLKGVEKSYTAGVPVVRNFSLEIEDKEFMVLLGPSGCGKTTVLRMIAGLESITEGEIYIGDDFVNDMTPRDRDVAMVFQNYALYPHYTIYENLAFSLRARKFPAGEIDRQVRATAELLQIAHYLQRKPRHLSGGERQRVALGRAIVRKPRLFLLDEPLSNLDAKLRIQMRFELSKLHRQLGTTTIYVTHDQVEALTLGDRLVLMNQGEIHQIGTPYDVYHRPADLFVAGFIGSPAMNFMEVTLQAQGEGLLLDTPTGTIHLNEQPQQLEKYIGKRMIFGFRPEEAEMDRKVSSLPSPNCMEGVIDDVEPVGNLVLYYITLGKRVYAVSKEAERAAFEKRALLGESVVITFYPRRMHLFDPEKEKAVYHAGLL
ncbi:MAG: sn-glycerol-3-phosphate ABC transporter ATP-binding protein UgpC [Candidatus Tectomicrobia bacterium]|nr:sn-glycerol-3-phosphate ABC transporter ATP-binding protein UgpC [Candidatus Tectomicrobia bacterium]